MTNNAAPGAATNRRERVVSSALWAAWADALGFISELTDEAGLHRRLGGADRVLTEPVAWKRRVGGRFGPDMRLPAGCYSDDTQLRLAVGRATTGAGFDVEAFARVELTTWPAYALGGGRASKAAARNLTKASVPWFGNFYRGWQDAGGNGAAMRIQPHVWAARPGDDGAHLIDVLIDAVVTHGHPRALFGAVLHAVALGEALESGQPPGPDRWQTLLTTAASAIGAFDAHPQLGQFWKPSWEAQAGRALALAWDETAAEVEQLLATCASAMSSSGRSVAASYGRLVEDLDLTNESIRGSGTHTVVAALALAAAAGDVREAAGTAARAIGTDTDTIATMAAAIAGAASTLALPGEVLDHAHLVSEAHRFADIAAGQPTERFSYPDLLAWTPPKTQTAAVGVVDGRTALAGIGWCEPRPGSEPVSTRDGVWQWFDSDFGASFLLKNSLVVSDLPPRMHPARRSITDAPTPPPSTFSEDRPLGPEGARTAPHPRPSTAGGRRDSRQQALYDDTGLSTTVGRRMSSVSPGTVRRPDVDQMLAWVQRRHFTDEAIGYALRRFAEAGTVEQSIAFATAAFIAIRTTRAGNQSTLFPPIAADPTAVTREE